MRYNVFYCGHKDGKHSNPKPVCPQNLTSTQLVYWLKKLKPDETIELKTKGPIKRMRAL